MKKYYYVIKSEKVEFKGFTFKQGYIFARASVSRPQPKGSHTQQ